VTILRKKFSPSVEMAARTSKILGCSPIANSTTYSSVWNGHYACTCYHPLFVFNQFGDLERCALRPGNVHSADGWDDVLKPVVARYQSRSHTSICGQTRPQVAAMRSIKIAPD